MPTEGSWSCVCSRREAPLGLLTPSSACSFVEVPKMDATFPVLGHAFTNGATPELVNFC